MGKDALAAAARAAAEEAEKARKGGEESGGGRRRGAHTGQMKKSGTPATLRKRSEQYSANITKRGHAAAEKKRDDDKPRISPWVIYLFVFIIIGSAVFQIINSATSESPLVK